MVSMSLPHPAPRFEWNREVVDTVCEGPSLTKQSFKDECDVNVLLEKYLSTGLLDHVVESEGRYGDFLTGLDYHSAMNVVVAAREAFEELPAKLRRRFHEDPAEFLDFVADPENVDEMRKLGLLKEEVIKPAQEPPSAASPKAGGGTHSPVSPPSGGGADAPLEGS